MFLGQGQEKKNNRRLFVGYDLGNRYSQISYIVEPGDNPETVALLPGTEEFNIPTCLCKRFGAGQWFFGKDAKKRAANGEGTLVENLLEAACNEKTILVEGTAVQPIALLTLFVKRSLSLLNAAVSGQIEVFMMTTRSLDERLIAVLEQVVQNLEMRNAQIMFQSHVESLYYYTLHQPGDLWNYQMMVFDLSEEYLVSYCMECNRHTTPIVAYIDEKEFTDLKVITQWSEEELYRKNEEDNLDRDFLNIVQNLMSEKIVSSVYLIGDGFQGEWQKESLRFLCRNRRVFKGNNMYSKGAALSAMERVITSEISKSYVYLGKDKCKSNIGLPVVRRGQDSYFALLDAGQNWFEAKKECDFLIESGNSFSILITPLTGERPWEEKLELTGLPERPLKTTRLHLSVSMLSASKMKIQVQDLGFGEIFQPTLQKWTEEIDV